MDLWVISGVCAIEVWAINLCLFFLFFFPIEMYKENIQEAPDVYTIEIQQQALCQAFSFIQISF